MSYARRYVGGFVDLPSQTTAIDSTFLNAVEAALLKLFDTDPTVDGQVAQWISASTKYGPALILNKNVDPSAGIVKSKLDLTGANGIVNADIAGAAAIAKSKLAALAIAQSDMAAGNKITASTMAGGPPGSPSDGDMWIATSVDANGTAWKFRYNAGSASSLKWEFIGGGPMMAQGSPAVNISALTQIAATGWFRWTTAQITLARAGEYDVRFFVFFSFAGGAATAISVNTGFIGPDNIGDLTGTNNGFVDATKQWESIPHESMVSIAAGQAVAPAMQGLSTNTVAVGAQAIAITPRRII